MSVLEYFCLMYFNFESLSLWQKKERARERTQRVNVCLFNVVILIDKAKEKKKSSQLENVLLSILIESEQISPPPCN